MSSYFSSFFGTSSVESPPDEEETRQREARRRKAAAEARKKREQAGAEEDGDDDDIAAFSVGGRKSSGGATSSAKANARVVSSRPAKPAANSLPAITEEGNKVASAKTWSAVTNDPEEMKRLASRAQAAQEQAVADLMSQVREQQDAELNAAVEAAREQTSQMVEEESAAKHAEAMIAKLAEAAQAAEEAQAVAVAEAVATAVSEAEAQAAEAMAVAEERHADAMAAAAEAAEKRLQDSLNDLRFKLEKQHQATLVTSAAMVRHAEKEGDSKLDVQMQAMREMMVTEHEADKAAAVEKAVDEANAHLAKVRLDSATEKANSVSEAVQEAIAACEAANHLERQKLAERQKAFNITFKRLMQDLVDQPDRLASPRLASPSTREANLTIKYES